MTPKQRQIKLETILALITVAGFTQDHYGNYKNSTPDRDYRIKIKKVNIRIEQKMPGTSSWHKLTSQPISKIDIQTIVSFLTKWLKQSETK